jgi:hypothetical protein
LDIHRTSNNLDGISHDLAKLALVDLETSALETAATQMQEAVGIFRELAVMQLSWSLAVLADIQPFLTRFDALQLDTENVFYYAMIENVFYKLPFIFERLFCVCNAGRNSQSNRIFRANSLTGAGKQQVSGQRCHTRPDQAGCRSDGLPTEYCGAQLAH